MGRDARGYRRLFGVLGPSTNTIVQPDFDDMRPVGVTNHYSRIYTPNSRAISDETFMAAVPLNHPLAKEASVTPEQLKNETMLLLGAGHCFRDHVLKVCPEFARFSSNAEGIRRSILFAQQASGLTVGLDQVVAG